MRAFFYVYSAMVGFQEPTCKVSPHPTCKVSQQATL